MKNEETMTEKEAKENKELRVIMLLSGYVRELKEGKDFESTTYELAETIVKLFDLIEKD